MTAIQKVQLNMRERRELNFGRFFGYVYDTLSSSENRSKLECKKHKLCLSCDSSWDCTSDYLNGFSEKYLETKAENNLKMSCMTRFKVVVITKYLRVFNHMLKHAGPKYTNKCHSCKRFITRGTYSCQDFSCIANFIKEIYPKYKEYRVKLDKAFQERLRKREEEEREREEYYDHLDDMDDRYRDYDGYDRYDNRSDCGPRCAQCGDEREPFSKWGGFCSYRCHPDYGGGYDSD